MFRTERVEQEDGSVRTRSYYDSCAIGEALVFKDPERALVRRWHPNGVLASEKPYNNGLIDGVAKYWNDRGELVDSYEITNGTGVWRIWQLDQQSRWHLKIESMTIDAKNVGRRLEFFDDGATAVETYWINDKKVSKKRYFEACQSDPSLPRYEWEPPVPPPRPKPKPPPPAKVSDDLPLELLKGPAVREALAWLEESRQPWRSLGEGTQSDSVKLVKKLYSLGAVAVHAVEIDGEPNEDQNSGKLVVELPQDAGMRKKLLQYSGRLARKLGFDPDPDTGQRFDFMMLD